MNLKAHNQLRNHISVMREGHIYRLESRVMQMNNFALACTWLEIGYRQGGRYAAKNTAQMPATWSRDGGEHDIPYFDCAGFMEMILYSQQLLDGDPFSHRGLRRVPHNSDFYKQAAAGDPDYEENWIPAENRPKTVTELNGMGQWPAMPYLLFFREEFVPAGDGPWPHIGDMVFFLFKDAHGVYHNHVGLWGKTKDQEGLIHCSPASTFDEKSGPKFTPYEKSYYKNYLEPQRWQWEEKFKASLARHRDFI